MRRAVTPPFLRARREAHWAEEKPKSVAGCRTEKPGGALPFAANALELIAGALPFAANDPPFVADAFPFGVNDSAFIASAFPFAANDLAFVASAFPFAANDPAFVASAFPFGMNDPAFIASELSGAASERPARSMRPLRQKVSQRPVQARSEPHRTALGSLRDRSLRPRAA